MTQKPAGAPGAGKAQGADYFKSLLNKNAKQQPTAQPRFKLGAKAKEGAEDDAKQQLLTNNGEAGKAAGMELQQTMEDRQDSNE